jgi:hypothetical protein
MIRTADLIDSARMIAAQFSVPENAVGVALQTAVQYQHTNRELRSEFSHIIGRFPHLFSNHVTGKSDTLGGFRLIAEQFSGYFRCGERSYRSIRFRNDTDLTLRSRRGEGFFLSYIMKDGQGCSWDGPRTPFPIPMLPGDSLTVPLEIVAPDRIGLFSIDVYVVEENVSWFNHEALYSCNITVSSDHDSKCGATITPHAGYFDFSGDLENCGAVLHKAVGILGGKGVSPMILEIACGSDPQSTRHYVPGSFVVASDLCYAQVQLSKIISQNRLASQQSVEFVCADVFNLPFKDESFDIAVVTAALHHFSDVTHAVKNICRVVKKGGLIVIMREPCKVCPDDPTYIQELQTGFNEQQFEVAEYITVFQRNFCTVVHHQIDYECSYKAIFQKN